MKQRTKAEIKNELHEAQRTLGFVLQYDPDCVPGWERRIEALKEELAIIPD